MPTKVYLNDGRAVIADREMSLEDLDKIADLAESGNPMPKGFTVQAAEVMREAQAEQSPNMIQQAVQAASSPVETARGIATEAVGRVASSVMSGMPGDVGMATQPATPGGLAVGQAVVPQTPDQLMSTLALAAVGPLAPSVGIMGVLARTFVPMAVGMGTNYALEREQDPTQIISQLVGSMVGEGLSPAMKLINSQLIRNKTQNAFGDKAAEGLANILNQTSSVKIPGTPRGFEEMMLRDRQGVTAFHKAASTAMENAEDSLTHDLMASMAQLPQSQRQTAMFLLEDAAGMAPKLLVPTGAPPSLAAPVNRVVQANADVVLGTAIHRARKARMDMSMAKSEDKYQLAQEYDKIKEEIRTALTGANPLLAQKYDAMNTQYAIDLDTEFALSQLEKAGAWSGDTTGTHFNPSEAANAALNVDMKNVKQNEEITKLFAGPSQIPGARPSTREGVMRMFMQLVTQAPSVSLGAHKKVVTVPTGQVQASHVRALQDYLATTLIHGMAESVIKPAMGLEGRAP